MKSVYVAVMGVLCVGALGSPIAEKLCRAGSILVVDTDLGRVAGLGSQIESLASPREVADRADIVFACLAEERHHRDALLGTDGILHGRRCRFYVHLGTSGSPFMEELTTRLSDRGIATVDAPVTGGPPKARAGDLTPIISGAAIHVDY